MVLMIALGLVLCAVTATDLRRRLIPDEILAAAAVFALAVAALGDPASLPLRLAAGLGAGGFLLAAALIRPEGMGLGDVKLAAVLGLYLREAIVAAMLIGLVAGSAAGIVLWARHGRRARRMAIPFAPFLALGGAIAMALAPPP